MSAAQDVAAPPNVSGIKLGSLARFLGIALGIASVTLMATEVSSLTINERFATALKAVEAFVGTVVYPFEELIVAPAVRFFREQGYVFELRTHWHNAFVLLWLYSASYTRAVAPISDIRIGDARSVAVAARRLMRWAWVTLASLAGGALAGTVPIDSPAVLWWPVAAFFATWAGNFFIDAIFDWSRSDALRGVAVLPVPTAFVLLALERVALPTVGDHPLLFCWPVAAWFLFWAIGAVVASRFDPSPKYKLRSVIGLAAAIPFALLALGALPVPEEFAFKTLESPGLVNLAAFVVVIAAWYALLALFAPDTQDGPRFTRWRNSHPAKAAVDTFVVLGVAATIVYLAHLLA